MKITSVFNAIENTATTYRKKLTSIPESIFKKTPSNGGWSYSEVYTHIFELSLLSLEALDGCLKSTAKQRKTPLITRLILFFGSFPPAMKFKVPKQLAAKARKIDKTTAATMILDFEVKLKPYYELVKYADPKMKTPHPKLGYLNAAQWIRFIEIHLKHHLKQLERIDKSV
jgi:hypothetical protein